MVGTGGSLSGQGIEQQNPIVLLTVRRRSKILRAFVWILADGFPGSVARVVPLGFHLGTGELVHVNADRLTASCVSNDEAAVFRSRSHEAIRAAAGLRRQH